MTKIINIIPKYGYIVVHIMRRYCHIQCNIIPRLLDMSRHQPFEASEVNYSETYPPIRYYCYYSYSLKLSKNTIPVTYITPQNNFLSHGTSLHILTWKCASRHNSMHFFSIPSSKSGPKLRCFVHFDLEMCFAPQQRALFRHLNFQKCAERGV